MPILSGTAKDILQDQIAPGDDDEFYRLLTEADGRLLKSSDWSWTKQAGTISLDENNFAILGEDYESIVGARIGSAAKGIVWRDFEYYDGGPGEIIIDGCEDRLVDRGLIDGDRTYFCTDSEIEEISVLLRFKELGLISDGVTALRCPVLAALKQMMLSIIFEEANDTTKSQEYRALANSQLREYEDAHVGIAKQLFPSALTKPLPWRSRRSFP